MVMNLRSAIRIATFCTAPLRKQKRYGVVNKSNEASTFKALLMKLYLVAHPDTLRANHPKFATVNDSSFQVLNAVLSSMKQKNSYPSRMNETIPFFVKINTSEVPVEVILEINTPGGDCRKVMQKCFQKFFVSAGIIKVNDRFNWGTEYFPAEVGQIDNVNDRE